MQALGRGRGVNRGADTPLEVHVLADVVLRVAYELVHACETVRPDILQQMLLAGLAVRSPKHAHLVYPSIFQSEEQATKAYSRGELRDIFLQEIYREMLLKSASYWLDGRGQGCEKAWWIRESGETARTRLEAVIGAITEWQAE